MADPTTSESLEENPPERRTSQEREVYLGWFRKKKSPNWASSQSSKLSGPFRHIKTLKNPRGGGGKGEKRLVAMILLNPSQVMALIYWGKRWDYDRKKISGGHSGNGTRYAGGRGSL